jgi:pyrroline-5-carboxylate reductase
MGRDLGRVVLAGAGQMGGSLLGAWIDAGLPVDTLEVVDPRPSAAIMDRLAAAGIRLQEVGTGLAPADILVLAIKPQTAAEAAQALRPIVTAATLLVSVVAGKTIADLRRLFPDAGTIARAMPNTPAAIGRGITGVAADGAISPGQRAAIDRLLSAVGRVEWLADETLIDAVTAVSGSGPAYVFLFVECLAKAAQDAGFDAATAMRFARATVEGAGALLAARPAEDPAVLRRNVTSPNGTTAAALDVFMRDDALSRLVGDAVAAAKRRAGELAG